MIKDVTKGIKGSWNGLKSATKTVSDFALESMGAERFNDTRDGSTNPSQDDKGDKNTKTVNDSGTKHNNSFIKDNPIVAKAEQKVNDTNSKNNLNRFFKLWR